MPRKTAAKDSNGGKLGQYTTEVKNTIEKAKEEQKKESAAFFLKELESVKRVYEMNLEYYKNQVFSSRKSPKYILLIGIVIGSALMGLFMSV